jgi:HNH endonuclease
MTQTLRERFEAKIIRTPEHWKWSAAHFKQTGYALFCIKSERDGKWRPTTAHRVAWQLFVGPIPPGMVPDHIKERCQDRGCIKVVADEYGPAHIELVTHRENTLRGNSPAAQQARQTHCKRGHEFTPENTRVRRGKRECITCVRAQDRARNKTEKRREHYRAVYRRRKAASD